MPLPFSVTVRSGRPVQEQVVFAVTRAIVRGQLRAGDDFPSVRLLSQELGINPNTAQKIVSALVEQGLLETRPGIGTSVADWRPRATPAKRASISARIERLVVQAKEAGLDLPALLDAIRREWK